MQTLRISSDRWKDGITVLMDGGVVAIPTDTVYGIAALPGCRDGIERIYEAKDRPGEKALPILVSGAGPAAGAGRLTPLVRRLIAAFWPGALTIVVRAAKGFESAALNEDGTVALRMPDDDLALAIIAAAGGLLAVTSANRSGSAPATTASEVLAQLHGRIDAVIDGGPSPGGTASTVVRVMRGRPRIFREGAISAMAIVNALGVAPG